MKQTPIQQTRKQNSSSFPSSTIQTYSGILFSPLDPKKEEIRKIDIAHSLSLKCRYSGHCKEFYSVAEHGVRVSWLLRDMGCSILIQYAGLHHDDAEAYLVDLPTPLKKLPEFSWYREKEDTLQSMIYEVFGCPTIEPPEVKRADKIMLLTEKRDLMPPCEWRDKILEEPIPRPYEIRAWPPKEAETAWLVRNKELEDALQTQTRHGTISL